MKPRMSCIMMGMILGCGGLPPAFLLLLLLEERKKKIMCIINWSTISLKSLSWMYDDVLSYVGSVTMHIKLLLIKYSTNFLFSLSLSLSLLLLYFLCSINLNSRWWIFSAGDRRWQTLRIFSHLSVIMEQEWLRYHFKLLSSSKFAS